jgi:uncharacterized repeat protein (TIGR01451 family)/fimbrial isopeptide formation D2 family protein
VQEHNVTISKVVTTAPVDAGDTVSYTITLTNTSGSNVETGYEWNFTDTLNTHLQFDSISNITSPGYATFDSTGTAGQDVSVAINYIDPGDSVSFRINAIVRDTAPANFIVPNTGNVTVTSLPGANGTTSNATGSSTPGATGTTTGERSTSGNSSVNTTLGTPTIDKQSPVAGSIYSIGQMIAYPIVVTVPEGVVQNTLITDELPAGLRYESHSVDVTGFSGVFANDPATLTSPAVVPGTDGEDVILDFGNISTPGTSGTTDTFTVTINARVTDVTGNYEGQTLSNNAFLTYTNPNTALATNVTDTPVVVTIREPRLSVTKNIATGDPRIVGDTLSYTVDIESDGSLTAYEWSLADTLPSHTSLSGTPTCTNGGSPVTISHSVSLGVLTISPNPLAGSTLPNGEIVSCTYDLTINSTAVAGTTYTNTADADWRNSEASSGFGRAYTDAVVTAQDGTQDTDTAEFTMEVVGMSKTDNGQTTAVVGESIDYTITVGAPNATLVDFVVTDTLPAGLIFNNDSAITGTTAVAPVLTGPNDGTAPTTVTWDFGDIPHDGTTIVIDYSARVANIASTQDGTVLSNDAEVSFTPELSLPVVANDSDSFTVQEPELQIAKSNNLGMPRFGETVTYTLDVSHTLASTATAHDIVISDVLPAGMSYVSGSADLPVGWSVLQSGQTLTFSGPSLATASTASITYDATLSETPAVSAIGDTLTNTATITWTSLSGTNANERSGAGGVNDYSDVDTTDVVIQGIELEISKDDQVATAIPGDTIIYQIDYVNNGNATANSVVITETVPDETVFDTASSTPGWSCNDGDPASTTCTFAISSIAALGTGSVDFAVRVLALEDLTRTATQIDNTVTIASATSDGPDALTSNNEANETTPLEVADVQVTKVDSIDPVYLDHDYEYELIITNNGPDTATNITLTDSLPAGVSYRGNIPGSSICNFVDPTLTCTLGSLANGASETITLEVTGDAPGLYDNTATITHDQQDPDLDNNTDTEQTFVDPADLALTKTADKSEALIGDTVTFTIVVTNNGPDAATGVIVTDTLPAIFSLQSATSTKGSCSGTTTIACTIGTLNNGESATITVVTKVVAAGTATNTATATLNEYDPDPDNSTDVGAAVTTKERPANLADTGGQNLPLIVVGLFILLTTAYVTFRRHKPRTEA